ncbi:hypothetical protein T09_3280 [Trichinella sp. T9]|nr:hypothetical protein T09_3280 [Trichinella sp. T9]
MLNEVLKHNRNIEYNISMTVVKKDYSWRICFTSTSFSISVCVSLELETASNIFSNSIVAFVMLLLVVEPLRTLSKNSHQKERNVIRFRDVVKKKGNIGVCPDGSHALKHCTQTGCPQGYYCYYDLCCQHTKPGSCPWQIAGNNPVAGPPCDTDIDCAYNLKCCTINQRSRCTFPYGYSGGTVGQVPPQPVPTSFAPAMPGPAMPVSPMMSPIMGDPMGVPMIGDPMGMPVMAGMPFDMYGGGGGGFLDYPDMYGGYGGGFGYDAKLQYQKNSAAPITFYFI